MPPAPFSDPLLKERFASEGFLVVPGPSDLSSLRELWSEVDTLHEGPTASTNPSVASRELRRRIFGAIEAVLAPVLVALVPDYRVVAGGFLVKRAGAGPLNPHLHSAMIDEKRHTALIAWLPLDSATEERGCMSVAPGSHRQRSLTGHRSTEGEGTAVPMEPGGLLVMDNRLLHGSRANRSGTDRLAVTALAVPREAPLWFCREVGPLLEIYQVPDGFYVDDFPGRPPEGARPLVRLPAPAR